VGSQNTPTFPWEPIHVTHEDKIWGFAQRAFSESVNVSEWDILGASHPLNYTVHLPVTGYVSGTAILAGTDRIAWLIDYYYTSPIEHAKELLHLPMRRHPLNLSNSYGIWVSDLHGNHMKEVGSEQFDHAGPGSLPLYGGNYIKWLPGGKRVAFHDGGDLYTISVDQ
jgi:hypothetical protein